MARTEIDDRGKIVWIAQRVRAHDRFCFPLDECLLEKSSVDVSGDRIVVDEDGHCAVLDNWRDRGGKSGCAGNDFITVSNAIFQFLAGQRTKRDQVGGRAGVGQNRSFDADKFCESLLELFAFFSECEPKVEHARNAGFDFVLRENTPGIGHDCFAGSELRFVTGPLRAMHATGILAGQFQNLRF